MIFPFLLGTAFILGGNIITAEHVVAPHTFLYAADDDYDVASIETGLSGGLNSECRKLKTGERVVVKGYPLVNGVQTYTEIETKVLGYDNLVEGRQSIILAAEIAPGFSGAPVVDKDGDVVAVLTDSYRGIPKSLATSICKVKNI